MGMIEKLIHLEEELEKGLDPLVDKMDEGSKLIFEAATKANSKAAKNKPWNQGLYIAYLVLSTLFFAFFSIQILTTGFWQKTNAYLSYYNLETIELHSNNPRGPYDYKANLRYTYRYNGKLHSGNSIYIDGSQLFDKVSYIDAILKNKKQGDDITVFVNPRKPDESALVSGGILAEAFFELILLFSVYSALGLYVGRWLKIF